MKRWMMSVVVLGSFVLPGAAQTENALRMAPEDALGFLCVRNVREFLEKCETLGVKQGKGLLDKLVGKDIRKAWDDQGTALLIVVAAAEEKAPPQSVLALPIQDPALLFKSLAATEPGKDGVRAAKLDWFGEATPILVGSRDGFVLLAESEHAGGLRRVLSARANIAKRVPFAGTWLNEQDVVGFAAPDGLQALHKALGWKAGEHAWLPALGRRGAALTFGLRIEKDGNLRIASRFSFSDDPGFGAAIPKADSLPSAPLSLLSDERYLAAAAARIPTEVNLEALLTLLTNAQSPEAKAFARDAARLGRRITEIGSVVRADSLEVKAALPGTDTVLVVKVDDAAGFVADASALLKKHGGASIERLPGDQSGAFIRPARKNAATWILAPLDRQTVLVGAVKDGAQVEQIIKQHALKPVQSLESNGELKKTRALLPGGAHLAAFVSLSNVFRFAGADLGEGAPLGVAVRVLSRGLEADVVVPKQTVQALVKAASTQNSPPLLPRALPVSQRKEQATQATLHFWKVFHENDYNSAAAVIKDLTAAWEADKEDAVVARLLGACHGWKFMERGRAKLTAGQVLGDGIACLQFLDEAAKLDPDNRVVPSIQVCGNVSKALILKNPLDDRFETLRKNTERDPVMNGFVQGWVFSAMLDHSDKRYQEGIEAFFATLDESTGFAVPRRFPGVNPLINTWLALRARQDSARYNSDVAPHNLEGTYLGLGDALVKQGKITEARRAYESVKDSPNYRTWKYKDVLEARLANLEVLRDHFRKQTAKLDADQPAMFFQSSFACSACHAK